MLTAPRRPSLAIGLMTSLAASTCDQEVPGEVAHRGLTIQTFDPAAFEPTPGSGGCEGCVSTLTQDSNGYVKQIGIRQGTHFVGASIDSSDDRPLETLLLEDDWQLFHGSAALCMTPRCGATASPVEDPYQFLYSITTAATGRPDRLQIRLANSVASLRIRIPSLMPPIPPLYPSVDVDTLVAATDPVADAMAHITYGRSDGLASCSGFLISAQHVLTAAHCFTDNIPSPFGAHQITKAIAPGAASIRIGGRHAPDSPGFASDVHWTPDEIYIHCDRQRDIAIARLSAPVAPTPLMLPSLATGDDGELSTYGYGVLARIGVAGSVYDWGWLKRAKLISANFADNFDDAGKFRAFESPPDGISVCRGDSGGPVIRGLPSNPVAIGLMVGRLTQPNGDDNIEAVLETIRARKFAFSNYNICGIGNDGDKILYVATRLDDPLVSSWIQSVLSGQPTCQRDDSSDVSSPGDDHPHLPLSHQKMSMNESSLSQRFIHLLAERLESPSGELTPDTRLRDVGLDSILFLDLLIDVEEELGHKIPDLKMPADPCIRDVVAMIQRNIESLP